MNGETVNSQYLSSRIEGIRYKLWSVNKLPLPDIYNSVLELVPLQSIDQFIPMTRECIKVSKHDPYLIKYLHLFDMLMKHPLFNFQLQFCLVEFYSKIVSHLKSQKLWTQIEQSKIMRKYWARCIHFQIYQDMRNETLRITDIDVDKILSVEAIQNIRNFYVRIQHLTTHQLYYYLPQLTPSGYSYSFPVVVQDDKKQEKYRQHNHTSKLKNIRLPSHHPHQEHVFTQKTFISPQSLLKNTNNQQNKDQSLKNTTRNYDSLGKPRCESEQTNPGDNLESLRKLRYLNSCQTSFVNSTNQGIQIDSSFLQQIAQKERLSKQLGKKTNEQFIQMIENSQEKLQAASKLAKLNSLNCYQCIKCGVRFQTEQSRKQHTESHVALRLKQLERQEITKILSKNQFKKQTLVISKLWTSIAQQRQEFQCIIALAQIEMLQQIVCSICCSIIKVVWRGYKWVYEDATRAILSCRKQSNKEQYLLIHKSCSKIIEKHEQIKKNENFSIH